MTAWMNGYNRKLITFVKEVRNLSRLGFGKALPLQLKRATEEAKAKYPYAMRLEEIISAYERACKKVDGNNVLMLLAAGYRATLQNEVAKGSSYSVPIFTYNNQYRYRHPHPLMHVVLHGMM
jgi:hypothetical protein